MDAQAIKTLGGICQILGVLLVVWDLLNIHDYLGHLGRVTAWMRARRAQVEAALRRLLGGAGPPVVLHPHSIETAVGVDAILIDKTPAPFTPQPGQPVAEQLAAQAEYLNQLHDWVMQEVLRRDEAIRGERGQARAELEAEAGRLDRLMGEVRAELKRLGNLTTGGIGLRWVGVPFLLFGVVFTTWDEELAGVWPAWLSVTALGFLSVLALAGLFCWLILAELHRDGAAS
jgi:hypothetical protein